MAGWSPAVGIAHIVLNHGEGITRAEIAQFTGYSKSTVSLYVDMLLTRGLIYEETDTSDSDKKRRNLKLFINRNYGIIAAVDFGITSRSIGICDFLGNPLEIIHEENVDNNQPPIQILEKTIQTIKELVRKRNLSQSDLVGVGIGIPSPIDYEHGVPISPPYLRLWDGFEVRDFFEKNLGVPAYVDNDVNVMARAEHAKGGAIDCDNFLTIKLGTGIGCGIYCNGVLYRGTNGCAGDIGHIQVEGYHEMCTCGNRGCLETIAGAPAIVRHMTKMAQEGESPYLKKRLDAGEEMTCQLINEAISRGDLASIAYIKEVGQSIGAIVSKLVNFFNPTKIIFSGGLSNFGDILLSPIKEVVYGHSAALAARDIHYVKSTITENSGIIGAALFVQEEFFANNQFVNPTEE